MRRTMLAAGVAAFTVLACCAAPASAVEEVEAPPADGPIVFSSYADGDSDIYTMDPDGSNVMQLTNSPGTDEAPSYARDGAKLVFTSERDGGSPEIYLMNPDGTAQTRLTHSAEQELVPTFWPDGARILFTRVGAGDRDIFAINADGTGETQLTSGPDQDFAWGVSPDAGTILFTRGAELFLMDADGSNPRSLTSDLAGSSGFAGYSRDGARIAFTNTGNGDGGEIWVMDADGSDKTRLTVNNSLDNMPTFSPDGTRIAFTSQRDGGLNELYVMDADGGDQMRLTADAVLDLWPDWGIAPAQYSFTGFFAPVDADAVNVVKAGRAVPVKFSLDGDQGLGVIADGSPRIEFAPCEAGSPVDLIEQTSAANSGLSYDAASDTYTYVWKTGKTWAGACGTFTLELDDGSVYTAAFQFT